MFVIKRKCQALYQRERERVENFNLEVISITESKFVMVYILCPKKFLVLGSWASQVFFIAIIWGPVS